MKKLISILLILSSVNCFRNFRLDNPELNWTSGKPILKKAKVEVDAYYFAAQEESFDELSNRLKIGILEDIKKLNIFQEFSITKDAEAEIFIRIEFKPTQKGSYKFQKAVTRIIHFLSVGMFPQQIPYDQTTMLIVKDHNGEIYRQQITEKTTTYLSVFFFILGPFFDNAKAYDRMFHEHSNLLLKDFHEFYNDKEKRKEPLMLKGKK